MIAMIKEKQEREQLFKTLYMEAFPGVCKYVSKMGGSFEEAKDVFQDALLVYFEQVQVNKLELKQSDQAYLFGISRNLWNKRFGENNKKVSIEEMGNFFDETKALIDPGYEEVSSIRLLRLLTKAGGRCMELLSAFYYEKLDLNEVAQRFGFSGSRSATVQKFKCLEKVKETVKQKSLCYEDIIE
jgi:RNA polymerase sigma factor (sigma-70 family)